MSSAGAPRLIAISDSEQGPLEPWLERLEALLAAARPGSVLVLLRDPGLPIRERQALGQRLKQLTLRHAQALSVGERLDLALLLEADGVHLPEAGVSVEDARRLAAAQGRSWLVSAACHDPAALEHAQADAVLLSPLLAPRKGRPALGLTGLTRALEARRRRAPGQGPCALFPLGGVTRFDAAQLLAAGADGVALIGELFVPGAVPGLVAALGIARGAGPRAGD